MITTELSRVTEVNGRRLLQLSFSRQVGLSLQKMLTKQMSLATFNVHFIHYYLAGQLLTDVFKSLTAWTEHSLVILLLSHTECINVWFNICPIKYTDR